MKRYNVLLLLISLFFICAVCYADGEEQDLENEDAAVQYLPVDEFSVTREMVDVLVQNLDNFFPISSQKDSFSITNKTVFSDIGPDTMVHTYYESDQRHATLIVNADGIHDHIFSFDLKEEYVSDFQITLDVTVNDVFPLDKGGCYVGFTNENISAGNGAAGMTILLYLNGQKAGLYIKPSDMEAGSSYFIQDTEKNPIKLSLIHFLEYTYLFLDDTYAGQYHDALTGPFRMMYGSAVFAGGESAGCSFDNLIVRKVTNQ